MRRFALENRVAVASTHRTITTSPERDPRSVPAPADSCLDQQGRTVVRRRGPNEMVAVMSTFLSRDDRVECLDFTDAHGERGRPIDRAEIAAAGYSRSPTTSRATAR